MKQATLTVSRLNHLTHVVKEAVGTSNGVFTTPSAGNMGHFTECSGVRGRICENLVWISSEKNASGTCAQCAMEGYKK